jgi:NAD(P)-dependent dehydrogenase (short-subunit alcohol dehydrogenase family)
MILITGATDVVGRETVRLLVEKGAKVAAGIPAGEDLNYRRA